MKTDAGAWLRSALFGLSALGCFGATGAAQAAAQQASKIRVATTPIELGAEVFYAKDIGFFKKAGLDVEVSTMESGAAIASGVASGAIDIAQANVVSIATAHDRGIPFVVIAPAGLYSSNAPTTALLVGKNSPIKTAKDLNGKTVGVNGLRNITQIGADAWIEANGGDPATVQFIEMPFPQMAPALAAGRLDAAIVAEPSYSLALQAGARELAPIYTAIAKEFLIGAWFSTSSWTKAHPQEAKRFVGAIIEAARWANSHHVESAKILERYTRLRVTPQMRRTIYAERLEAFQMQPLIDAAVRYKVLRTPFPAGDLIASGL